MNIAPPPNYRSSAVPVMCILPTVSEDITIEIREYSLSGMQLSIFELSLSKKAVTIIHSSSCLTVNASRYYNDIKISLL